MADEDEKPSPPPMVLRAAREPDKRPRVNGVLAHRMDVLRSIIEKQLLKDAETVSLANFAFMDDVELAAARRKGRYLNNREKRIAREWEKSKKEAPLALQVAHERIIAAARASTEAKGISINVEKAVIRVPDTQPDRDDEAVILDVEAK